MRPSPPPHTAPRRDAPTTEPAWTAADARPDQLADSLSELLWETIRPDYVRMVRRSDGKKDPRRSES